MYDKESIAKEKCKSRLFKGLTGWMTRHVAVFTAVALVMISALNDAPFLAGHSTEKNSSTQEYGSIATEGKR